MTQRTTGSPSARPAVTCTYRLQMNAQFTFADAVEHVPQIAELGVSHLYLSPIGQSQPGSDHGYDWVPPPQVWDVLGGLDGLRDLRRAASDLGIGIIVDIVPNHTGVADPKANCWWWDVLTHGADSQYARYFDIDFAVDNGADGRIALPVLGEEGDESSLELVTDESSGDTELAYYEHRYPVASGSTDDGADPQTVHDRQHYKLVPWRSGLIGYRRFFSVDGLAGLRQEDPEVYDATHTLVRLLAAEDLVDGIRVDHPDGLADPIGYLTRLRADLGDDRIVIVEKILSDDEPLDPGMPVQGTTGYDHLAVLGAVLVDPSGMEGLTSLHAAWGTHPGDADWLSREKLALKRHVATTTFPSELARLRRAVIRDADAHSDPDLADLTGALTDIIAGTPVYRGDYPVLGSLLDDVIAQNSADHPAAHLVSEAIAVGGEASVRLAQVSGAVMAKSVEDCLFYRTARLVSTQEVGCDPIIPTIDADTFHWINRTRAHKWPTAMTATSTHDTKRGEDVRARISLLSQVPARWSQIVRNSENDAPAPEATLGLFFRQNLFGIWPVGRGLGTDGRRRFHEYATKAMREGGVGTSWIDVDEAFESSVHRWIDDVIDGPCGAEISTLVEELAPHWYAQSHVQKALAMTVPGFPDIYQGTQWYEDSLADPDNRRPVDYDADPDNPKTRLVTTLGHLRKARPAVFGAGSSYVPLLSDGPGSSHVLAFGRGRTETDVEVVVAVARWTVSFSDTLRSSTTLDLPDGDWHDIVGERVLSGTVTADQLFADGAVAVLTR
ncbi:malto-oligosyltrehalose synthase [Gordonia jinhuaensis]|uniref:Maltooligosyl trehalose synthase n=1 Tax=Gordonia jinhuaensis TaxID=1517702 RepID=A0A916SVY3_9ACTN|nr:malto-oligosyltrehalose synthase [Gordonia jinhuaensis]GGB19672.1 putative maltooligosyl trehalose synthase [Gordonia jinhuaensis]